MRDLDIGEVATRVGVPASTLRYYCRIKPEGLWRESVRRPS